jgi:hypothetical protein
MQSASIQVFFALFEQNYIAQKTRSDMLFDDAS